MKKKHKKYRSSVSGEFTSKDEAEANPRETVSEVIQTGTEGADNPNESVKQSDGEAGAVDGGGDSQIS